MRGGGYQQGLNSVASENFADFYSGAIVEEEKKKISTAAPPNKNEMQARMDW